MTLYITGWIQFIRKSGKLGFFELRDGYGSCQVVYSKSILAEKSIKQLSLLKQEVSLTLTGRVKKHFKREGYFEVELTEFHIIGFSEDYPITKKDHGADFLLERRHLWLRSKRQSAIMRIRSTLEYACRTFLQKEGFYEFDSPIITPSACEGTTTLFELDYHGESAYLSQSGQLYSEAGIMALEKTYCFGPCFRAEKAKTRRHLMEFWGVEPEMAWYTAKESIELQKQFLKFIIKEVVEKSSKDLQVLGRDISELKVYEEEFPVILYDEALKIVQDGGFEIKWGDDFGVQEEEYISSKFRTPFFIYKYPVKTRAFYIEPDPERPEVALSSDCLLPGVGEIITGGQRASDYEYLLAKIAEHGLKEEDFKWYLDLRKYGSVPHSGFGMGIERMLRWLCGVKHIRETIPFPRTLTRMKP